RRDAAALARHAVRPEQARRGGAGAGDGVPLDHRAPADRVRRAGSRGAQAGQARAARARPGGRRWTPGAVGHLRGGSRGRAGGGRRARRGKSGVLRRAPRGDHEPRAGAGDRARGRPRAPRRIAAGPTGQGLVVDDRLGGAPRGPGDAALVGQGGRVSRPRVDLPPRRADARHGMAARDRPRNRIATYRAVVPERGVAVSTLHDARTPRLTTLLATLRRGVVERLEAVDVVTLVYVAVATAAVLAFSGHDHAGWDLLLTAHALILILVLIAPAARQAGPVGRFLGDWYPMLLLGGLYAEVGVLNVDLAYQHDLAVQRLEVWAFGSQLSYRWIREMPNPLLSWFLHGCYLAYYAILYASPLGLWLSGRRSAARRTIFAVMVTFYLCYVVF